MVEIHDDIKSLLCEVTQELLYNIVYENHQYNGEINYRKLRKEFKSRVGHEPMDFFGLGNITDKGWFQFLKELPGLVLHRSLLSIDSEVDTIWEHYNSNNLFETNLSSYDIPHTFSTITAYREMLLIESCDLLAVEDGIDVDCTNGYGNTPLHLISALPCVHRGNLNLIRYLLNAGANPLKENNDGLNILHVIAGQIKAEEDDDEEIKFGGGRIYATSWEYGHRKGILTHLSHKISPVNLAYLMSRPGRDGNTVMHEWAMSTEAIHPTLDIESQSFLTKEINLAFKLLDFGGNLNTMNVWASSASLCHSVRGVRVSRRKRS